MARRGLILALTACLLAAGPAFGRTSTVAPLAPEWMIDHWGVDDGLPLAHISGLALAPDGSLWLATVDGLAQFDGQSFRVLRRANEPALPTNRFTDIVALPDGQVWALGDSGDVVRVDGEPKAYRQGIELVGRATRLERLGDELWLTTTAGLMRLDGAPSDLEPNIIGETYKVGPDGTRWSAGPRGVYRVRAGAKPELVLAAPAGVDRLWVLAVDEQGTAWIGGGRAYTIRDGVVAPIEPVGTSATLMLTCGYIKRPDGTIELRSMSGLWRVQGNEARLEVSGDTECRPGLDSGMHWPWRFADRRVLREDRIVFDTTWPISVVLPTSDGGAWVATIGAGLVRFRPRLVTAIPAPPEWVRRSVDALMIDRRDVLWLGSQNHGLWRSDPPGIVPLHIDSDDPQHLPVFGFVDADGVLDVGSQRLCRVVGTGACEHAGEPARARPSEIVAPLLHDRHGQVWTDKRDPTVLGSGRLFVRRGDDWREMHDADGAPVIGAHAAAETPDGDVIVTTLGRGVLRFHGDVGRRIGVADGLASERVRSVYVDPRGVVWLGTEDAGLCRWSGAHVGCVGKAQGLFDDIVHAIVPDDMGRLWLSGNRGISWVRRDVADAAIEGRTDDVLAVGLDERDGMANREANGILPQSAARDSKGRIYFATQDGAAMVDPTRAPIPTPPRVSITNVTVAGRAVPVPDAELELDADERSLAITWTAPALDASRDLRFRHRLVGLDDTWRTGLDRGAQWLSLPAGEMVLEIEAGLAGAWSAPRRLFIRRAPTFVESAWFPLSIAFGVMALAVLGTFAWSRRQVRARARLERQIAIATAHLVELNATRTRFVADLSHELRTPLGLVMGPLEDLASRFADRMDDDDRRRLAIIRTNVARLEQLNDQLLDVARLEAHEVPLRAGLHDLGAFVRGAAERFRPALEKKGLRLELQVPAQPIAVYFDADLIDKVLSNLIGNALKFTERGYVRVTIEVPDGVARVAVVDSGVGIPAAELPRLFERFYQVDRGDARRFEGVGIGLALVRELVTLHGGESGVASVPDLGSTFWFTLPRGSEHLALEDIDPRPRATVDVPLAPVVDGAGPEVLLVEDHPDMRAYLAEHLAERFSVRQVASGEAALAAIAERLPRAIVSDVMMPGMDGLTLCRTLRSDPRTASIPIVLVSAKASEADRLAGLEVAADYLTKPIRPRELVARVARLIPSEPEVELEVPVPPISDTRALARIAEVVQAKLGDPLFGVSELAAELGTSARQLQRDIRKLAGCSPVQYLRGARMDAARALLRGGAHTTVAAVANAVGMSPAYFSRVYTVWFGVAPSDDQA